MKFWIKITDVSGQNYSSFPQQFLVTNLDIALPVLEKIQGAGKVAFFIITQKLLVLNVSYTLLYRKKTPLFEALPSYNLFVYLTWKQGICFPTIF